MSEFSRRIFIRGAALAVAAPAIVRADSLMNIFVPEDPFKIRVYDVTPTSDASKTQLVYRAASGDLYYKQAIVSSCLKAGSTQQGAKSEMIYQIARRSRELTADYLYKEKGIRDMKHIDYLIKTRYTPDKVLRFV